LVKVLEVSHNSVLGSNVALTRFGGGALVSLEEQSSHFLVKLKTYGRIRDAHS
jgi:hypothetical protein